MSVKAKNSLSTFLEQSMILERNSLATISKINDAMVSGDESITLTLTDPNDPNKTTTYQIPSFGYLKKSIERLDATLSTLANVSGTSNSRVRLSDGTYRKIITSKIPSEAPSITKVNKVTNFNFKSNWFFEDMLNPCLYISWDLSDQISVETERVLIQRYILTCDTSAKKDVFDSKLKGKSNIDYNEFISIIVKNKIKYTLDEDVRNLPPHTKRYSGTFTVLKSSLPTTDYNGKTTKTYTLSTLQYSDNKTSLKNTRILSVGDYLEVDTNPVTTRYRVSYVDTNTSQVRLELVEGGQGLSIGSNLKIGSTQDMDVNIEIPVGYDEREVVFIKPIDPESNIPANNWSPGVGFYTNELTYVDGNGNTQTLQKFYQQYVVDFGQVILSYAKDYYPSLREGIIPDSPSLRKSNFKIVKVNTQSTEYIDSNTFRKLVADKAQINSEIDNITKQITEQKTYLQTTNFVTSGDKDKAYNTLHNLINKQNSLVSNYNSVVNTIKARSVDLGYIKPRYRVRGFWEIPVSKMSPSSGEQKVIKFIIRYRYLTQSGNKLDELEIPVTTSNSNVVNGKFSNWTEIDGKTRQRVQVNNEYVWKNVDLTDPEEVKINQLDIPICPGEGIEIQVKSVSEAGWPSNPLTSGWSNSVVLTFADFPELQGEDISDIIEQNKIDAALAGLAKYTRSSSEHMATSFYTNDKYFAHTAETITSGFLTPEQTPITLYDKLQDLNKQINEVIEKINMTTGNLIVTLVDEDNKVYNLNEGSTTYVYAGDYLSEISQLTTDEKKGAIVTKVFQIDIKSDNDSGLYLMSKIAGNRLSMCPNSRAYSYVVDDGDSDSDSDSNADALFEEWTFFDDSEWFEEEEEEVNVGDWDDEEKPKTETPTKTTETDKVVKPSSNLYASVATASKYASFGFQPVYKDLVVNPSVVRQDFTVLQPKLYNQIVSKAVNNVGKAIQLDTVQQSGVGTLKGTIHINRLAYQFVNRYELYDNVLSPKTINSAYYSRYGRYDLVPINLSNSDIIDYQIASPNMYQSAQCCGQFIYSRFSNIAGTFNMYGNIVDEDGKASYNDLAPFAFAEKVYGSLKSDPIWKQLYPADKTSTVKSRVIKDFELIVGEQVANNVKKLSEASLIENVSLIMNRLPVTYTTSETLSSKFATDKKIITRLNTYTSISDNVRYTNLLSQRLKNSLEINNKSLNIVPKVQAAYGFGNIIDQLSRKTTDKNNIYLTTHKIGYEDKDRYATGEKTCDSFLFLSPTNHQSIQVEGDTTKSAIFIAKNESIKVPLVFQYRMTDYNGYIFGNKELKSYDTTVRNTKYANIVGIDIWTDVLSDTPKQFDIVVYSTYGGQINTDTGKVKTSTQVVNDALVNMTTHQATLLTQSQLLTKK